MKKFVMLLAALGLNACTLGPDGEKHLDRQKACEVTMTLVKTVAGIAAVLEANGIKPDTAREIATAALSSGDVVAYTCAVLVSAQENIGGNG